MIEKGFPWDSAPGDARSMSAADFAAVFKSLIKNGVIDFDNDFIVEISNATTRTITISSGKAWINGHMLSFDGVEELTLPTGNITTGDIYPGLIVLKCRPENEHRDFAFQIKYLTDGTEPQPEDDEIALYYFKYSKETLQESDFKRCVTVAVPNNMFIHVLKRKPDDKDYLQFGDPQADGTIISGLAVYSSATGDAPYMRVCPIGHQNYGWCTAFNFFNGLLIANPSKTMSITLIPERYMVKMPDGTIPFDNNQGSDPYTAMRWQSSDGSKNTQVVCKENSLMCFINGIGTELAAWTSDKSLKKNIKNSEISALDIVLKIKHKQFDWRHNGKHQNVGYVANDLEKLNSEFVVEVPQENGEVLLQVNPHTVIPVLSKAIQEQHELIVELQNEVKSLNKRVGGVS